MSNRLPFAFQINTSFGTGSATTFGSVPGIEGYVINLRGFTADFRYQLGDGSTGTGQFYVNGFDDAASSDSGTSQFFWELSATSTDHYTVALSFPEGVIITPAVGSYPASASATPNSLNFVGSADTVSFGVIMNVWGEYIPVEA